MSSLKRTGGGRTAKDYTIVISYDGTKTEDDYFRSWSQILSPERLTLVPQYVRSGGNVLKAVEESWRKMKKLSGFAEFWCVCDVDDTPSGDLGKAEALAKKLGIRLCTSKRSFEVWLALHFELLTAPLNNEKEAIERVQRHLAYYGSPRKVAEFSDLFSNTLTAVHNGEQLEAFGLGDPETRVHNLVRKLFQNYQ